jgi:hypothetical protein
MARLSLHVISLLYVQSANTHIMQAILCSSRELC